MLTRRGLVLSGSAFSVAVAGGLAHAQSSPKVTIASPPNPHVFPLLLAMHLDPSLPVTLRPVTESKDADALLASGEAQGVLAMSYIGARKRLTGAAPDLRFVAPGYWRGFFQVCNGEVGSLGDLAGKDIVISGPAAPGRGGGGDVLFRAVARLAGLDPDRDFRIRYLPMLEGVDAILKKEAIAITLPSPGSTGLMTLLGTSGAASIIDLQTAFDGDSTFGKGQLPLGGLHLTERAMRDKQLAPVLARLEQGYLAAGESLMRDPSSQAPIVAKAFQQAFQSIGAPQPMPGVLIRAIASGDLVFGPGPGLGAVRAGTISWLERVLDHRIAIEFVAPL